ncbi:MAG: endonuclease III [Planctomycetota bacterium]|nr:endonuclease III [Planctomycetota bacterium]
MDSSQTGSGRRARDFAGRLARAYPDIGCSLDFEDPLQCLVATMLSAQCTDRKVNLATPALFKRFPDIDAFAKADAEEIEPFIHSLGLFRRKAANIAAAARIIRDRYGGAIPNQIEQLVLLPGVGRKTANCVILNAYGRPGIMCDTHFCRVTRRFGLHDLDDPDKIEAVIARLLPPGLWGDFSHRAIHHGREVCRARNPACGHCPVGDGCAGRLSR